MVYPNKEFFSKNTEFVSRHKSMQAEAEQHYRYLLALQKVDKDFDRMLFDNHARKKSVESLLSQSKAWAQLSKKIKSNGSQWK